MALSVLERDALIGDVVARFFQDLPPATVRRIAEWTLLMASGENDEQRLIERWRQLPPSCRSDKAAQAVARTSTPFC